MDADESRVRLWAGWFGKRRGTWWCCVLASVAALVGVAIPVTATAGATGGQYQQTNLISDIPGVARITDPNLVNPWGQAASASSPLWVADNGSDVSTLYQGGVNGSIPQIVRLVVSIPGGAPTGVVFNSTPDFKVQVGNESAAANFVFDSETGQITAWSKAVSGTSAQVEFTSSHAVYKGLALAAVDGANYLYAANFHTGKIDVFNARFKKVRLPGRFKDAQIPAGFAPFDVQLLGDELYVTYAKQDAAGHDDVAGPGNGFVDVYDTSGHLLRRLISGGDLNSPWGLVLAPAGFGAFAGDLLVGNFGDGAIHAYDPAAGVEKGQLTNTDGNPILVNGLWALRFGNGTFATDGTLVFTAGIGDEAHGLLGEITPASLPNTRTEGGSVDADPPIGRAPDGQNQRLTLSACLRSWPSVLRGSGSKACGTTWLCRCCRHLRTWPSDPEPATGVLALPVATEFRSVDARATIAMLDVLGGGSLAHRQLDEWAPAGSGDRLWSATRP